MQLNLTNNEVVFIGELVKYIAPRISKLHDKQKGFNSVVDIVVNRTCTTDQLEYFIPSVWRWAMKEKEDHIKVPSRFETFAKWEPFGKGEE